jgi:hypothetical protein
MQRRALTPGELEILKIIQIGYGPQNTEEKVFFDDKGAAAIFVIARDGTSPLCAVLTNLAKWRADGTIASDHELKCDWLQLKYT